MASTVTARWKRVAPSAKKVRMRARFMDNELRPGESEVSACEPRLMTRLNQSALIQRQRPVAASH